MGTEFWQSLAYRAHDAFRTLVPRPQDRTPIDWRFIPHVLLSFIIPVVMAYLARKQNTYLLRLLLLPLAVAVIIRTAFCFVWTEPTYNVYNWGQGQLALSLAAKVIEFALAKDGMLKVDESSLGVPRDTDKKDRQTNGHADSSSPVAHAHATGNGATASKEEIVGNGHASVDHRVFTRKLVPTFRRRIPEEVADACDLVFTMRGLGWKFGKGCYVPPEWRSLERNSFLSETLIVFLKHFLILDVLESHIKLFPGIGSPYGGSIFYENLPVLQRYAVSTLIHGMTGTCLLAGFEMCYALSTLIAVGLFQNEPSAWPPILDDPWHADSLHIFWARRWHQILRHTFIVYGAWVGRLVPGLGTNASVVGIFAASGMLHEGAAYAMGRGFDWRVFLFFIIQAPLLLSENIWRRVTGHRVSGLGGQLWVYFCIFLLGQPLVDAWHKRGLGGGRVIPMTISPTRRILFPLLMPLVRRFL